MALCACKKNLPETEASDQISSTTLAQIKKLGFSTQGVQKTEGGYIVEGDIFLSTNDLSAQPYPARMIVAQEEQYRTFNVVNSTNYPKIKIALGKSVTTKHKAFYAALNEAIKRYNALKLNIKFQHGTSSNADIIISIYNQSNNTLAFAGFPTSDGAPHSSIMINKFHFSSNMSEVNINYIASILAHEIGHCIGFRHTDFMNRAYSCGGSNFNEGETMHGIGAVHIPGTPTTPNANSWMLACIGSGVDRPFTANDKIALGYIY